MDSPLKEFNEVDWYSLVDYATVYKKEDIKFTFKNGMNVKAWRGETLTKLANVFFEIMLSRIYVPEASS